MVRIREKLVQMMLVREHDREDLCGILKQEIDLIEIPEDCEEKVKYVVEVLLEKYPERRHPKQVKKEIKMTPIMLRHREVL